MTTSPGVRRAEQQAYRSTWTSVASLAVLVCGVATLVTLGVVRFVVVVGVMATLGALFGLVLALDLPRLRRPVLTGAAVCSGATLLLVGTPGAAHGAGMAPVLLLVLTSPPLLARLGAPGPGDGPVPEQPTDRSGRLADVGVLLGRRDDQLSAAWCESETLLREATTAEEAARVVALRQLYLDEVERRSPEAFGRWLATQSLGG